MTLEKCLPEWVLLLLLLLTELHLLHKDPWLRLVHLLMHVLLLLIHVDILFWCRLLGILLLLSLVTLPLFKEITFALRASHIRKVINLDKHSEVVLASMAMESSLSPSVRLGRLLMVFKFFHCQRVVAFSLFLV